MVELQIVKQSAAVATAHKPKLGMMGSSFSVCSKRPTALIARS